MERIEEYGRSLPADIWFEILLRLPLKKSIQLKCVCRSWHDLITDRLFTRKHPDNSPSFVFVKYTSCPPWIGSMNCVSFNFDDGQDDVQVQVSRLPDPVVDGMLPYFDIHDSCGGLLLITLLGFDPIELCLYNPVSGSCEFLPEGGHLCLDWKIVNVDDTYTVIGLDYRPFDDTTGPNPAPKCLLLDRSSDSWKELAVPRGTRWSYITARGAVRRKGKVYWLVHVKEKSFWRSCCILETSLLYFDPANLQIGSKPCSPMPVNRQGYCRDQMFEYDGTFYRRYHPWHKHYELELWVLRDLDSRRPVWVKQHVSTGLPFSEGAFDPVAVLQGSNKIIFISHYSKGFVVCDMITEKCEFIYPEVDEEADESKSNWQLGCIPHKIA